MAGPAAIRVEGLDELRRNLRRVKDSELDDEMKAIHLALAREIVDKAMPNVPVKSGDLRASLRSAGTKRDAIGRVGSTSVPYAAPVHWGRGSSNIAAAASIARGGKLGRATKKRQSGRLATKANPFLREAAQEIERDVTDRYETQVAQMLDRVVGR